VTTRTSPAAPVSRESRAARPTNYPDATRDLSRWLPLVKWLAAIPHYVVLLFL